MSALGLGLLLALLGGHGLDHGHLHAVIGAGGGAVGALVENAVEKVGIDIAVEACRQVLAALGQLGIAGRIEAGAAIDPGREKTRPLQTYMGAPGCRS